MDKIRKGVVNNPLYVEIRTTIRLDKVEDKELIEKILSEEGALSKIIKGLIYTNNNISRQQIEESSRWTPPEVDGVFGMEI